MKKKKTPDPMQIALDPGFLAEPAEPLAGAADAPGKSAGHARPDWPAPAGGSDARLQERALGQERPEGRSRDRGTSRSRDRSTSRGPAPEARSSRADSDWASLQEHAPEGTPDLVPAGFQAPELQPALDQTSAPELPFADAPELPFADAPEPEPPSRRGRADMPLPEPVPSRRSRTRHPLPSGETVPMDPDSWEEPVDLCPIVLPPPVDEPPLELALPEGPADFHLPTRIAWSGRRPYSIVAGQLKPGDPVRLVREPDNPHDPHAIRIVDRTGEAAGYVYAEEASWLSLLLDLSPPERDESAVIGQDGRHVAIGIRLHLATAWQLFTIVAVFGLRSERFARAFNLAGNPVLQPLAELNRRYLAHYDYFKMPPAIVDAYARLRQQSDESRQRPGAPRQGRSRQAAGPRTSDR